MAALSTELRLIDGRQIEKTKLKREGTVLAAGRNKTSCTLGDT